VAPIAIGFGIFLIALGVGGYYATDQVSWTALIPAFFGLPLVILGLLARKDSLRKHAMHAAAVVGLLGFLGAAGRLIPALLSGKEISEAGPLVQAIMALACAVFVGLCVKSFVDARRRRAQGAEPGAGVP
jgi:uncharacterized membrane protein